MSDSNMLNGEWEIVASHIGGASDDANIGARIDIQDGVIRDHHARNTIVYEFETDDSQLPKHMTWNMVGIEVNGTIQRMPMPVPPASGIYELEGDRFTFCWSNPGRPFPTDFTTGGDPDCHCYVCRRVS